MRKNMKRKSDCYCSSHVSTHVLCTVKVRAPKRVLSVLLVLAMLVTMAPQSLISDAVISADAKETSTTLKNPQIVEDSSMESGQKVTWDCVWFGNYPQTEIVDKPETSGCYGKDSSSDSDYKVDATLYEKLKGATYDSNGDTTIDGTKYRRINASDAADSESDYETAYNWSDSSTYHYFRYDPIKWRVLNVEDGNAFLLADKAIDDREYNTSETDVTWEKSTIRSWLNGYGSSSNNCGTDYSSKNFIDSALTSDEQSAIETSSIVNKDNLYYGTEGGNDTYDKIFLLSESEVYTDDAIPYGFLSDNLAHDEARKCQSSAFAKAMGAYSDTEESPLGSCWWQLRSPGDNTHDAEHVWGWGLVNCYGIGDVNMDAVRPALNLNLLSSNLFSYAGTVCSDGTMSEVAVKKQENAAKTYTVTLPKKAASGTISASADNAKKGDTVKLTVKANDGYKLKSLTVKNVNGKSVKLKTVTDGSKYSFTMPASDVTVEVTFVAADQESVPDGDSNPSFGEWLAHLRLTIQKLISAIFS